MGLPPVSIPVVRAPVIQVYMNPMEIARARITSHGGAFLASRARRIRTGMHTAANNNSVVFIITILI
jgi:hypothetical protein